MGRSFDVPHVWAAYARHVDGVSIAADHYLCEEAPHDVVRALTSFWRNTEPGGSR
ncbi:hypothetical protein [Embleya sp. AB8]|uniref:hypothetical protein n=1 Tax=Embleya sp. AB8 TaxID=3156304 RepID=UPI003C743D92